MMDVSQIEQKLRRDFPELDIHVTHFENGQCTYHFVSILTKEEREAVNQKVSRYCWESEQERKKMETQDLKPLFIEVWHHMKNSSAHQTNPFLYPPELEYCLDLSKRAHEALGYTAETHVESECPLCFKEE